MRDELRAVIRLATPLAIANAGMMALGVVAHATVGRIGEAQFAGVGLGNSVYFALVVIGLGAMLGIDPLIAQALGANEKASARRVFQQGLVLAVMLSAPITLIALLAIEALLASAIDPAATVETASYMRAKLIGLLPQLVFIGARSYLQARGSTRPLLIGVVAANIVNVPACQTLVFGLPALGIPALGTTGAGLAGSLASIVQMVVALIAVRVLDRGERFEAWRADFAMLRRVLALGIPIGLTLLAEVGVFMLATVIIGHIGTRPLAAHHVALTLASATFQVPLAVGAAAAVRVGRAIGRGDTQSARAAGFASLIATAVFMSACGLAFFLVPRPLSHLLTDKEGVIEAAVPLLFVAAVFQLADGTQAVGSGALRGAGDTRIPLLANVLGHYAIGLPLGLVLAFGTGLGAQGIWWGLSAGLSVVAVALVRRFARLSARKIERA